MRKLACALLILTASCAESGIRGVHYGMESAQVRRVMGAPDRTDKDADDAMRTSWVYNSDGELCTVEFFRDRVFVPPRCQSPERKEWLEETARIRSNPYTWEESQAKFEQEAEKKHEANLALLKKPKKIKETSVLYVDIPSYRGTTMVAWDIPADGRASRISPLEYHNHNGQAFLYLMVMPMGWLEMSRMYDGTPDRIHDAYVENQKRESQRIQDQVNRGIANTAAEAARAGAPAPNYEIPKVTTFTSFEPPETSGRLLQEAHYTPSKAT
ncbi:MAG: hypothetical protein ACXWPM_05095, partial [Bdellovibrionota bacterium]